MDIMGMQIAKKRSTTESTVLYRSGGVWRPLEVDRLVNGLMTEVSQHPQYPEYLILCRHFTKAQALEAIGGCQAFIAEQMTGVDGLPFTPGWI